MAAESVVNYQFLKSWCEESVSEESVNVELVSTEPLPV